MNRREFMGGALAGVAVAPVPSRPSGPSQSEAAPTTSFVHAKWLNNGLIDAGGSHEPYIFSVRRGGGRRDARQIYQRAQSEGVIRRLKEQGVEVFHTHLYKGFGMAAERPGMEDAKRAAEIAHRYGMRVDTYIQWNTMMYETFFAEEPRAKHWVQRDVAGLPILLTYGYQQSFRYRPCFGNQEYLDYLKKVVRYAVEEAKTDFIHFDNFDLNPEPDSCHCPACVAGFRKFLESKYPAEMRRERFGFDNVEFVNPPQWNRENRPEKMRVIYDPGIQEWIDYRCQLMADALRQMSLYAKSLNPEVVVEINPHGITGANRAWEAGINHPRLLKWTDVFWTEEDNPPGYLADGRLISKIRSYKLARAFGNVLMTYISQNPIAMAECLAFNQTVGYAGEDPLAPEMLKYLGFYRNNRDLFMETRDLSTVAVLRSYPSITYHNARAQLSAILVEQALIQTRVPFSLIFDDQLGDLSRYKALVLPDSECLSDPQVAVIRRFVENGGGLVAIGHAGLYDEWRRLRVEPGLQELVDGQAVADAYQESPRASAAPAGSPIRKRHGRGRAVYIPSVAFDGPLPDAEPYFSISNRFWKLPQNWEEIIASVRWAASDAIPLEASGPRFLVANLVEQSDRQRRIIHFVNYGVRDSSLRSIDVECRLPAGVAAREVSVRSPEATAAELRFTTRGDAVSFTVPEIKTYSVVSVSW